MNSIGNPQNICISIFKDGTSTTSCEKFTKAWINMINHIEQNKTKSFVQKWLVLSHMEV